MSDEERDTDHFINIVIGVLICTVVIVGVVTLTFSTLHSQEGRCDSVVYNITAIDGHSYLVSSYITSVTDDAIILDHYIDSNCNVVETRIVLYGCKIEEINLQ